MLVYFSRVGDGATVGMATFSVIPREGDTVYLRLSRVLRDDEFEPPLTYAKFKVERVQWEAFNYLATEEWMHRHNPEKDAVVSLVVSALDGQTEAYMQRINAKEE